MGQLLNYDEYVLLILFYNQNPLPREFGNLSFGFGVSYHSYHQLNHSIFPLGIQFPLSLSVTNGTRNHSSTVVIISDTATGCTRVCPATVVVISGSATGCTRVCPATVVVIPGSATSGTRDSLLR